MMECTDCEKKWHVKDTDFGFYKYFLMEVKNGRLANKAGCGIQKDLNIKTVPTDKFYECLTVWMETPIGSNFVNDIVLIRKDPLDPKSLITGIKGWRQLI